MEESVLLFGQTIEETGEGRMVIRSSIDKEKQVRFDEWHKIKGYKIPTVSETRIGKPINWDSRKSAICWKFFTQGAMEMDGRPAVRCLVCSDVLIHGGLYGPTTMKTHLKLVGHMKKAKELIYASGSEVEEKDLKDEDILSYLKRSGTEGVVVCHCLFELIFKIWKRILTNIFWS